MSAFDSVRDVWKYLDTIPMFQKEGVGATNFGLENIQKFCDQIGNPEKDFKSIHVAGTNGKGTTCHLLEAVYLEANYKTGMFTSPHLLKYNERVKINGTDISDELILEFFKNAELALGDIQLTFFEISTALAFWTFSKEKVDIAIIEVGLGGRLDSTNIINPELSIITSIGIDHAQILGNTTNEIAREKAGIIKKDTPVIIGNIGNSELQILADKAQETKSLVKKVTENSPYFNEGVIHFSETDERISTHFLEPVNAWNVALVKSAVEILSTKYPVEYETFKKAIEAFKGVPGRFEKLLPSFDWYFSGAHNEQAIDAVLEAVELFTTKRKVLIFTLMKDKLSATTLGKLSKFDEVYFYEEQSERGAIKQDIERFISVKEIDNFTYQKILNELKTELVIFAGSFYFYSTIKRWLIRQTEKPSALSPLPD